MTHQTWPRALLALVTTLAALWAGPAGAEPPSRAARLGYVAGTVSLSPAGQPDWVEAAVNRPLTTGDRLWSDRGGRAEMQLGGAAVRLGPATSATVLNLDDRITQLELSQGTLIVRVRRLAPGEVFEVNTPNLALVLRRAGDYRIEVDPDDDATVVLVRSGEGVVHGDGASYAVRAKRGYRFYGTDLSDVESVSVSAQGDDDLDRWARTRDRRSIGSVSARYVSPDLVGYEELDSAGTWRVDVTYGPVWTPARVATGWTPYHDGRWAWVDPWGWTWIDDAPWGYAVSHYGRWARINNFWSWVPGPRQERAVYAPAMVAFVGGRDFQVSLSIGGGVGAGVGWFPLAPREVYRPSYAVSRRYFENINRSNAVIAPTTITNIYNTTQVTNTTIVNNTTSQVVYVNQQVAGAVVAVPAAVFAQSQPVARAAMRLPRESASTAPVALAAAVVPMPLSVHGGAADAKARPPDRKRAIIARTPPPPPPIAFASQQSELSARPGRPIDEAQRVQLKPTAPAATAPAIKVVPAAQAQAPTAAPPLTPPAGKSALARRAEAARADAPDAAASRPERERGQPAPAEGTRDGAAAARAARSEVDKADRAKADRSNAEQANAQRDQREALKANEAREAAAKAEAAKAEAAKTESRKAEASRADASKAEAARVEAAKAAESRRADTLKRDAARAEASKDADTKARAARDDASKAKAQRDEREAVKANEARADAARAAESQRADTLKRDAARAEASQAAEAKARAARDDASKAAAVRAEAAKARRDAPKAEPAKNEAQPATPPRAAAEPPAPARGRRSEPAAKGDDERAKDDRKKDDREPDKRRDRRD